jgi:hypothetical protein
MPWQLLISGLLLGLISSVHCAGMCGPVALALPIQLLPKKEKSIAILLYNIGRIITYSLLGLIAGMAGRFIMVGSFQQIFSVVFGIGILVIITASYVFKKSLHITPLNNLYNRLQMFMGRQLKQQGLPAIFMLGMANGLLPCGMVYMAVTGALTMGSLSGGMLYMFLYGMGTLPAMLAISFLGSMLHVSVRNKFNKISPYILASVAVLLILRGLNLNIPYISPYFYSNGGATTISCH